MFGAGVWLQSRRKLSGQKLEDQKRRRPWRQPGRNRGAAAPRNPLKIGTACPQLENFEHFGRFARFQLFLGFFESLFGY